LDSAKAARPPALNALAYGQLAAINTIILMQPKLLCGMASVMFISIPLALAAAPLSEATVEATYKTATESDSLSVPDLGLGTTLESRASLVGELPEYNFALARATVTTPGIVKAYSAGAGATGGPIIAAASAKQTSEWTVTSATLPFGTQVSISFDVIYNGILAKYGGTGVASATASLTADGNSLYNANGSVSTSGLIAGGNWTGDFIQPDPFSDAYSINSADMVSLNSTVGSTLVLVLTLTTEIEVSGLETAAYADFFNSGSISFSSATDPMTGNPVDVTVQVAAVPEPQTTALGAAAAGLLFSLRAGLSRLKRN